MAKSKDSGESAPKQIVLTRLAEEVIHVPIKGIRPLIPHKWSAKAMRMLPTHPDHDKVKRVKDQRDPHAEAEACLYTFEDGTLGFPASSFKAAMIGALRFFDLVSMTEGKQLIEVRGEGKEDLVRIEGEKEFHEDIVRNKSGKGSGSPDLRYRYYIVGWSATLVINYLPSRITQSSVIAIADAAGRLGVGDGRPSSPKSFTGTMGTWKVDTDKEIEVEH